MPFQWINPTPTGSSTSTYGQGPKLGGSQASPSVQPHSQVAASTYQQSYSAYKPQTPAYTPYYDSLAQQGKTQAMPSPAAVTKAPASGATTYVPTYSVTSTASSGGSMVGYPSFTQSSYASAANAYYKQMKENKTTTPGQVRLSTTIQYCHVLATGL